MAGIEEFALGAVASLVASAVSSSSSFAALSYLKRKKIGNRVENATAEVIEPLLPFLANEGLKEEQQQLLFRICTDELRPFTVDSRPLFSGSLDGQKIFDKLYAANELPQAITDEGLENIYSLLCPRVATLLCRIPAAVKDWEANAWTENFSRLDEIAADLRQLFVKLDAADQQLAEVTSGVLADVRRSLAQKVSMNLDLTGLRADKPIAGKFSDFFVHPELERIHNKPPNSNESVGSEQEAVQQFSKRGTRAVVSGAPGSGKSTWTRWLQKELLVSSWSGLALRVELRGLAADSLPSVHYLIREQVTVHLKEELTSERVREWIEAGQLVLLLDGFDEIAPASRKAVQVWLKELAAVLKSCPVVLTSRPLTTDHLETLPKEWLRWEIKPFDKERIISYIQRWYAHTPLLADSGEKPKPESLAAQLASDPTIKPLTSNPLLLSTLLMVHHLDGSLPNGRAQLYRRYVDGMLGLWDDRRQVAGTDIALTTKEKQHILTELAVHLQIREKDQLDEDEVLALVRKCLEKMRKKEESEAVLAVLRERSGLLVGPGVYSFIHKSVAEYLVAEAAVQGTHCDADGRRIDRFALFEHRNDDRWNVVIFLWAGLASLMDVEAFIELCDATEDIPLGYGILDDQYDRFPAETKRRFILRFFQLKPEMEKVRLVFRKCNNDNDQNLTIFDLTLRGLWFKRLSFLFERAARKVFLLWADAKGIRGNLRIFIWMTIVLHGNDLEDWTACIKQLPAGLQPPDPERWMFWLSVQALNRALLATANCDLISIFCDVHPEYHGHLAVAMADCLVDNTIYSQKKERLANFLIRADLEAVPTELLLATKSWDNGRLTQKEQKQGGFDLLEKALQELQSWRINADQLEQVISKLSQLIARREQLASAGADSHNLQ
jgi:hypothetical protein